MSAKIKDFSALKSLRAEFKQRRESLHQELQARREQQQRQQQEAQDDAELFRRHVGEVAALNAPAKHVWQGERPAPIARQRIADEQAALEQSLSDEFSVESLLDTDTDLSYARPGVGADVVRKLRRGHWVIQEQLDLHGMRRDEAREAVALFLRHAVKSGMRCVRIIHGKGLGSVNREPVLKNKVRSWLMQKDEVMAYCQARAADGGSGALVVLLKA